MSVFSGLIVVFYGLSVFLDLVGLFFEVFYIVVVCEGLRCDKIHFSLRLSLHFYMFSPVLGVFYSKYRVRGVAG